MIEVISQWKIRASMQFSELIYLENNALIVNGSNHEKVALSESMIFLSLFFSTWYNLVLYLSVALWSTITRVQNNTLLFFGSCMVLEIESKKKYIKDTYIMLEGSTGVVKSWITKINKNFISYIYCCPQLKYAKKSDQNRFWWVNGHLRLTPLRDYIAVWDRLFV